MFANLCSMFDAKSRIAAVRVYIDAAVGKSSYSNAKALDNIVF